MAVKKKFYQSVNEADETCCIILKLIFLCEIFIHPESCTAQFIRTST